MHGRSQARVLKPGLASNISASERSGVRDMVENHVELRDFVAHTLHEILVGITTAQKDPELGRFISPWGIGAIDFPPASGVVRKGPFAATVVRFDVCVTAESTKSGKAGGEIKVWAVGDIGARGEMAAKSTAENRIQFSVHLQLPPGDGAPEEYGAGAAGRSGLR